MIKRKRGGNINASSMADIAFLLLVFFLVTTQINADAGIKVMLPPWSDEPPGCTLLTDRNILDVRVNAADQLLVEEEIMQIENLAAKVSRFLTQEADSYKKAIVSFQGDRGTTYQCYIQAYDQLKQGYSEVRNQEAQVKFQMDYDALDPDQQKIIRELVPLRISEAEPVSF